MLPEFSWLGTELEAESFFSDVSLSIEKTCFLFYEVKLVFILHFRSSLPTLAMLLRRLYFCSLVLEVLSCCKCSCL